MRQGTVRPRWMPMLSLLLCLLVSCVSAPGRQQGAAVSSVPFEIMSGTVLYPNNLYFPSRVRLEIILTSRNGFTGEERLLVSQSIRNPQRFPVNFILRYDRNDIISTNEHLLIVELYREEEDRPYLTSDPVPMPVLSAKESAVIELRPTVR